MPFLPSQSLFQEKEEVVQLWGAGDKNRAADEETRVPFKNQAENARGLEIGVIHHHSSLSSSESNLMTRRTARVREATHALPGALLHAWDASDRAT